MKIGHAEGARRQANWERVSLGPHGGSFRQGRRLDRTTQRVLAEGSGGKQTGGSGRRPSSRPMDFPRFLVSAETSQDTLCFYGYRSQVDDSIQPYVVTFPIDYGKDPTKNGGSTSLHGRDNTLTEVKMLAGAQARRDQGRSGFHSASRSFGRGNNAIFGRARPTSSKPRARHRPGAKAGQNREEMEDPSPSGLSCVASRWEGQGPWHWPALSNRWCVIGPGAGFTTTHGYIKKLVRTVCPAYQEACLHIYDAVDYAENAAMVPVVAYEGSRGIHNSKLP